MCTEKREKYWLLKSAFIRALVGINQLWKCEFVRHERRKKQAFHRLHHMGCLSCPTWHAQQSQPETVVDTCRAHYRGTQFQKNCMALQASMIGHILYATNTSVIMDQWQKLGLIINTALLSISFCPQTDALCRLSISLRIAPFSVSNSTWDETPSSQRLHTFAMVDLYLNDLMGVMPLLLDTFALEVKCCLLQNTHYANPQTASLMAKLFFPCC